MPSTPPVDRALSRLPQRETEEATKGQAAAETSLAGVGGGACCHFCLPIPVPHRRIILPRRRVHGALRIISGIRALGPRGFGTATGLLVHGLISCWIVPQKTSHHRRRHRRCTEDRPSSKPPAAYPRCRWARSPRCLSEHLGRLPLLGRRILLECGRVDILRWGAAVRINALRNRDGCPWQSLSSRCRRNRPAPHPLLAVPRNHWKETAGGGGYRAHLRVVTANNGPLIVGQSGPRNRRPVRAWETTDVTLFSHFQTQLHAEAPQCRMHGSTDLFVSSGFLASVVLLGSVSRHHEEGSSPGTADKHSPLQITASASLTSSAGSVMGQRPIGCFADLSWTLLKYQPLEYRSDAQRLTGTPTSQSM
ncbi:RNA-binding protein [Trypanosoma cruzi]|nr:RNA-binding protein [Trypanosoma cruzi]